MLEVINAVDPILRIRKCPLGNPAHLNLCPLHRRIDDAMDLIEKQFRETRLSEVLDQPRRGGTCPGVTPRIVK